MKRVLMIFLSTFILFSCDENKEKVDQTEQQETTQQEVVAEPEPEAPEPDVLIYTVQIGAFQTEIDTFSSISEVNVYIEEGLFKYRLGAFSSYNDAKKFRKELLGKYPDAFVQALKNDKPIFIQEALAELN